MYRSGAHIVRKGVVAAGQAEVTVDDLPIDVDDASIVARFESTGTVVTQVRVTASLTVPPAEPTAVDSARANFDQAKRAKICARSGSIDSKTPFRASICCSPRFGRPLIWAMRPRKSPSKVGSKGSNACAAKKIASMPTGWRRAPNSSTSNKTTGGSGDLARCDRAAFVSVGARAGASTSIFAAQDTGALAPLA